MTAADITLLQRLTHTLKTQGRAQYLNVLPIATAARPDISALLREAQWRTEHAGHEVWALASPDVPFTNAPIARTHIAWALSATHRALALQVLDAGEDPTRSIDLILTAAPDHIATTRFPSDRLGFFDEQIGLADDALQHARRFARDDMFPVQLQSWTTLAAMYLYVVHVTNDLLHAE